MYVYIPPSSGGQRGAGHAICEATPGAALRLLCFSLRKRGNGLEAHGPIPKG